MRQGRITKPKTLGRANRQVRRLVYRRDDKPKATNWWSDPPKLIPILLSVIALSISCLGWWESHRGRIINEEINRPILSLVDIDARNLGHSSIISRDRKNLNIRFQVKLKNNGKASAKVDAIEIEPDALQSIDSECQSKPSEWLNLTYNKTILSGAEESIRRYFLFTQACEMFSIMRVLLIIKIDYTDEGSGRQYSQQFAEWINVSPNDQKQKKEESLTQPDKKSSE